MTNGNGNGIEIDFITIEIAKPSFMLERSCTQKNPKKKIYIYIYTNLMASIICKPIFTQFAACVGLEMGKPDTQ